MRSSLIFWAIIAIGLLSPYALQAADITDITVEVTTDRTHYPSGEPVSVTVTQCNPTDETVTQVYGCPCCHDELYFLDQDDNQAVTCNGGCISVVVTETWDPGECKSDTFIWTQTQPYCDYGEQIPDGRYRAQHVFQFTNQLGYELITESPEFIIGSGAIGVPSLSRIGIASWVALLLLAACFHLRRSRG